MMPDRLDQICHVMDAAYQSELVKLRNIAFRETAIRRRISNLNNRNEAMAADGSEKLILALQTLTSWQRWAVQTQEVLNQSLAQILVEKARQENRVRLAHGRFNAIKLLLEKEHNRKTSIVADQTAQALLMGILQLSST